MTSRILVDLTLQSFPSSGLQKRCSVNDILLVRSTRSQLSSIRQTSHFSIPTSAHENVSKDAD